MLVLGVAGVKRVLARRGKRQPCGENCRNAWRFPRSLYHASRLNYCMICQHWRFLRAPEGGETVANPRFDLMMIPKFNYHCVSYGIEAGAPGFG